MQWLILGIAMMANHALGRPAFQSEQPTPAQAATQSATQSEAQPEVGVELAPVTDASPVQRLLDPATPEDQRPTLANVAIATPGHVPEVIEVLTGALASDGARPAAIDLLGAVRRAVLPPRALESPTVGLVTAEHAPLAQAAIQALASFRSKTAARALGNVLADANARDRHDAAHSALVTLTGRADVPIDGWTRWLDARRDASDQHWADELLAAHARRAQSSEARATRAEQQLADAWRQIYLLRPQTERGDVLARLLLDPTAPLRALGFELTSRELGESRDPGQPVVDAAITLLGHQSPSVRADAALLLHRLAPDAARAPVLAALERETHPLAADALLLAISRWPSPEVVGPTLRWMRASAGSRVRASASAWALQRAGFLTDPSDIETVLDAIRAMPDGTLSSPTCRLLATLGPPEDVARLADLLTTEDTNLRVTAADALTLRPDQVDNLLAAAANDPILFEPCARSLRTHLRDARGYDALRRLPAPAPHIRARELGAYAAILPTGEIVRMARLMTELDERASLLQPLLEADRSTDATEHDALVKGLVLLANAQADLENASETLRALDALPPPIEGRAEEPGNGYAAARAEANELRATVLVWLNRTEEAESLDASADAWIRGLELAIAQPFALQLGDAIAARFTDLSEGQAQRLTTLRQRLTSAEPPAPAPPESSTEDG